MTINTSPSVANQLPPSTGQGFLRRIHNTDWKNIWVASWVHKTDDHTGGRAGDIILNFPASAGHYYSIAHIRQDAVTRSDDTFESLWAIVLDDIGVVSDTTRALVDLSEHRMLLPEPTAIIETSRQNFQWVYALATPEPDIDKVGRALAALKAHPLLGKAFKGTGDPTHYFRLPEGKNPKDGFNTACVEFSGVKYEFDDLLRGFGLDPEALPAVPAAVAAAPASAQIPASRLREIMKLIPNDGRFKDRTDWNGMCHAIAASTQDEPDQGREIFITWSENQIDDDGNHIPPKPDEAATMWDTLKDDHKAGAETIRKYLEPHATSYKDRILGGDDGFTEEVDETRAEAAVNDIASIAKLKDEAKETEDLLLRLRQARPVPALYANEPDPGREASVSSLAPENPMGPFPVYPTLVPGYVRGYAMMLSGASELGKSAFSVGLTNAIVCNAPHILGAGAMNPKLLGDVVIISNEDAKTEINRRVFASRLHHGLGAPIHDYRITPSRFAEKKDGRIVMTCAPLIRKLIDIRKERDIALIVIDTLTTVISGLDENSPEMQAAFSIFHRLAWAAWACVVVIHHPSKAAGNDDAVKRNLIAARGSGSMGATVRSATTLSTLLASEIEEHGFSVGQAESIVVHAGSKNSWGRKAPTAFFNKLSVPIPMIDMDGNSPPGDALVLEYFIPTPRSMAGDFRTVREALAKRGGKARYDPLAKLPSRSGDGLDQLTGLSLKRLRELVPILEAAGKVRVGRGKIGTNMASIIEIADWNEDEETD